MPPLQVSACALEALSVQVRAGFEQRLLDFLAQHAPAFRREAEEVWRGYEHSARLVGLTTEQEIAIFIYGCFLLGDDIAKHDWDFFERAAELENAEHRLVRVEERVLAFALAREMIER